MKGSVRKYTSRAGKVSYQVYHDLAPDPVTGKRRQKCITYATRKEAEAALAKALHEVNSGSYVITSAAPLREYLARWLEAAAPTVRGNTVHTYQSLIDNHIIPALGNAALGQVSAMAIQAFYAGRLDAGLSPTTVGVLHAILHRAFAQAVKWRMLARNPCDGVDAPRPAEVEMKTWMAEQARAFLAATADDDLAALWRLALTTGMRQGEMLALTWDDLDLDRGMLAVRRTLTRDADGKPTTGEPKSARGRRPIALPPACVAALRRHRARQRERRLQWRDAWRETGVVFDRGDGAALAPTTVRKKFTRRAVRLGLPPIRFHDLRHTAATLALAEGIHPKIVQERLGHANVGMTLDRYSHVSMDMQREAAERVEKALGA